MFDLEDGSLTWFADYALFDLKEEKLTCFRCKGWALEMSFLMFNASWLWRLLGSLISSLFGVWFAFLSIFI